MYREIIESYEAADGKEAEDKSVILELADLTMPGGGILFRECRAAHTTASSMIFNKTRDKVLMVYHHIYQSYSWTGGHSDGEEDFLKTAVKEAKEETGLKTLKLISFDSRLPQFQVASVDVLTVDSHIKNGKHVAAHLHLNVTYLFEADENEPVFIKPDENSDVCWLPVNALEQWVKEENMMPIYEKLIKRVSMGYRDVCEIK